MVFEFLYPSLVLLLTYKKIRIALGEEFDTRMKLLIVRLFRIFLFIRNFSTKWSLKIDSNDK